MVDQPGPTVEEPELDDVAEQEVPERPAPYRQAVVEAFFDEALQGRLSGRTSLARGWPAAYETVPGGQDVDGFARRVAVVLGDELRHVLDVDVGEVVPERHGAAVEEQHVLVHPPLLDARRPAAPDAQ